MSLWKYIAGGVLGAFTSTEAGATLRGEDTIVNGKPVILRLDDANVRRDAIFGGALGVGGAALRGPKWGGVLTGGAVAGTGEVALMNFAHNQIEARKIE
jgi:hypothetical protein